MRLTLATAVALYLIGCSSITDGGSAITGEYVLMKVDGAAVPTVCNNSLFGVTSCRSGTLSIQPDMSFTSRLNFTPGGLQTGGTIERSGGSYEFHFDEGKDSRATFDGKEITVASYLNSSWTFTRDEQ